jgi:hypothetical protein
VREIRTCSKLRNLGNFAPYFRRSFGVAVEVGFILAVLGSLNTGRLLVILTGSSWAVEKLVNPEKAGESPIISFRA